VRTSWRDPRRRRRLALAALVVFVAGFEILPWVHVALHGQIAPHHHDASGAIIADGPVTIRVDFTTTDVADSPDHGHTHGRATDGVTRIGDRVPHAQHVGHHDIAVLPAPPPVTTPLPVDRRSVTLAIARAIEPISFSPGRAVARGPPIASA
jgi:hypothetical protein